MHLLVIGMLLSMLGLVHLLTNFKQKSKLKNTRAETPKQKEIAA
jgi:hypothetical protein